MRRSRVFTDFPNTALYSPLCYAPQALAIFIGRTIGLNPLIIFYLARIAALACWIAALYVCIRIIPAYKWLLAMLALPARSGVLLPLGLRGFAGSALRLFASGPFRRGTPPAVGGSFAGRVGVLVRSGGGGYAAVCLGRLAIIFHSASNPSPSIAETSGTGC